MLPITCLHLLCTPVRTHTPVRWLAHTDLNPPCDAGVQHQVLTVLVFS